MKIHAQIVSLFSAFGSKKIGFYHQRITISKRKKCIKNLRPNTLFLQERHFGAAAEIEKYLIKRMINVT
jgi:hypothetical protein